MRLDWPSKLYNRAIENMTATHMLILLICIWALIFLGMPRNYYLSPYFPLVLVASLLLAYGAGAIFFNRTLHSFRYRELEQAISDRTQQLALANQELEMKNSERRQAEGRLRESEARFRTIFDNASVGVALLDSRSCFLMVNDAFCSFLGYPRQEILQRQLMQFLPPGETVLDNTLNVKLAASERQSCMLDQRFVRREGDIVWGRLNASLIRDEQGSSRHKVIVCEDVTTLKTKESEIDALSRIYEAMHSALQELFRPPDHKPDGIVPGSGFVPSYHGEGYEDVVAFRVIEVARETTGATMVEYFTYDAVTETLSLTNCAGKVPEQLRGTKARLSLALNDDRGLVNLAALQRKPLYVPDVHANPRWIQFEPNMHSCYLVPLHYGERLFGAYVLLSDRFNGFSQRQLAMADTLAFYISATMENAHLFSEVQQAFERINFIQQQLLQSQKMEAVGQLAGGIAHDLNNQLTVIQASVDLNLGSTPDSSSIGKALRRIRRACERSANLIRQLLLFGQKHPQFVVNIDLNQNVSEMQEMLERLLGEDKIIKLDLAPDLWILQADATNIDQVLINLAINARDAMPEGGVITIRTRNVQIDEAEEPAPKTVGSRSRGAVSGCGSYVCLSVSDNGSGIPGQYLPHIFEPFFTTKDPGKGTGLGLSVAYGIVEAHGGWIDVFSDVGVGSTFEVFLPVDSIRVSTMQVEADISSASYLRGSGEFIMLVEDDPDVAVLTASLLSEQGYTVRAYRTVADTLAAFEQQDYRWDLVLCDAILPDGNGIELVRQLCKRQPSLEVILSSGYTDERASFYQIRREGLLFLPKPYTAMDLLRKVGEALEHKKSHQNESAAP